MTLQERAILINQYKDGYARVTNALRGITEAELDFHRARGKWSAREIVHHLADSEMSSAFRLRKLLAEHQPYIQAFDQDEFARKLHYSKRPIEPSLRALEGARSTSAQILDVMSEDDWKRTGEHSESGPYSVEMWLRIYAAHAHNHAEQIHQSRAAFKEKS